MWLNNFWWGTLPESDSSRETERDKMSRRNNNDVLVIDPEALDQVFDDRPDYTRRDEHLVRVRIEPAGGTVDDAEQDTFREVMVRATDRLNGQMMSLHNKLDNLSARLDRLATYIETQTRWQPEEERPELDSTFLGRESVLDYYLEHPDVTQREAAAHFHMNADNLRAELWAEAAARGLQDKLQRRINNAHARASHIAREKVISREVERRLAEMERSSLPARSTNGPRR